MPGGAATRRPNRTLTSSPRKPTATRRRAEEYLARVGALLDAVEAGRPLPDGFGGLWHALRQLGASQAMLGEQFKRLCLEQVFADMDRAAMEGAGHAAGFTAGVAAAKGRHRHRRGRAPGGGQLSVLPGGKTWKGAAVSGPAALKAAGAFNGHCREHRHRRPGSPVAAVSARSPCAGVRRTVPDSGPPGADTRASAVLRPRHAKPERVRGYGNPRPAPAEW